MEGLHLVPPAETPRTLWIELTSKCPLDCVFCSRKTRRGAGEHLPFAVYKCLVDGIQDPRRLVLNYSGESTVYPELIPAIRLARARGAYVELVSVLTPASDSLLEDLSGSGLSRLTVSVHAVDDGVFREIYGYGDFEGQRARLERFLSYCREVECPPVVDLAFVAMDRNLNQLGGVAKLSCQLGLGNVTIFPVLRRDEIPAVFPTELDGRGAWRPEFEARLRAAVASAETQTPGVRFTFGNPRNGRENGRLGEIPVAFPGPLPEGARIHSCEQNPWETAHVLANGDVVACEVLDRVPLGNLQRQTMAEIWHGAAYRDFRRRYHLGEVAECRACPWKRAYMPGAPSTEILADRGRAAQLVHGWHDAVGEPHVWSSQRATAVLAPRRGSKTLHVSGALPPGRPGAANELRIACNGEEIGRVANPGREVLPFGMDFPVSRNGGGLWCIEFRTAHQYRPSEHGETDQRDLGFALLLLASKRAPARPTPSRRLAAIERLRRRIRWIDWAGRRLGTRFGVAQATKFRPGISVLIPERANVRELAGCLEAVRGAAARLDEPVQTIVVANGSPETDYGELRRAHSDAEWLFFREGLGFGGAVEAGLRRARFDWVYLLNNDVELDPEALRAVTACRDGLTFGIGSQVYLKDTTRFRDETNWTTLFLENGLATIHDWVPRSDETVESFYVGGGASLFQTRLLGRFLDARPYHPFYWEDVEWGWRARKLGYRSVFCGRSAAHHRRRATIGKLYGAEEVEEVVERNRLMFQLRNLTGAGSLERVMQEIAGAPDGVADWLLAEANSWRIAQGRLWNHMAPVRDEDVLARWERSCGAEPAGVSPGSRPGTLR